MDRFFFYGTGAANRRSAWERIKVARTAHARLPRAGGGKVAPDVGMERLFYRWSLRSAPWWPGMPRRHGSPVLGRIRGSVRPIEVVEPGLLHQVRIGCRGPRGPACRPHRVPHDRSSEPRDPERPTCSFRLFLPGHIVKVVGMMAAPTIGRIRSGRTRPPGSPPCAACLVWARKSRSRRSSFHETTPPPERSKE